ncbi:MAG: phosphoribosylanthranilate isomerase [Lachnospiraceae bacterium]|nr:phosphoribosylanthranilate isomerase [Lachnospiraceae bacterium]
MTAIKLCGLTRPCDIDKVNALQPDYIGFVFWERSKRNISRETAQALKKQLDPSIKAVGVFVDPDIDFVAGLLKDNIIDAAQLHGKEDEDYISRLRALAPGKMIIKAYKVRSTEDVALANASSADYVLLDSGTGSGKAFDWSLIREISRPYFLAGGLGVDNVAQAVADLQPFAVDVSSGIETEGLKDPEKMERFVTEVRLTR